MLSIVRKDVKRELTLSTTPDGNNELRANISVRSFWLRLQRAFLSKRVIYPPFQVIKTNR